MIEISQLRPLDKMGPGRPFVNREREKRIVQTQVDKGIRGGQMSSEVICFWGAFGMGKSWLMRKLEQAYCRDGLQGKGSHPTIAARLDLNREVLPALWDGNELDRAQLVRELWEQLAPQLGTTVPDHERAGAQEWADEFVDQVTRWSTQYVTPIILLDTVDDLVNLDEDAFFWLERSVVERLVLTDRVLFCFTSRGDLRRWKRFQVRRRVNSHRLTAFDALTAGQEVEANADVSQELYQHAFGHPLVTEYMGRILEGKGINLQTAKDIEHLIEQPTVQVVLSQVVGEILKPVPAQWLELARQASVLRWLSVELLRAVAEATGFARPGRGDAYYLDRMDELQVHHLLYWSSDKKSREPDPALRRLLAHLLELEDRERFLIAHKAAFSFHFDHLKRFPAYLARYVPEVAYHRTMLGDYGAQDSSLPTLEVWWGQFLAEQAPPYPQPWDALTKTLEQDQELRDVLRKEDYERLSAEAEKRSAGMAS